MASYASKIEPLEAELAELSPAEVIVAVRPSEEEKEDLLIPVNVDPSRNYAHLLQQLDTLGSEAFKLLGWEFWRQYAQQTYNDYLGAAGGVKVQRRASRYSCPVIRVFEERDFHASTISDEQFDGPVGWQFWITTGQAIYETLRIRQRERENIRSLAAIRQSAEKAKLKRRRHPYGGDHAATAERIRESARSFSPPGRQPLAPLPSASPESSGSEQF